MKEVKGQATSAVDVVVPCYKYGHFLRQCVESILTQNVPVRVLIIDDASPDNTREVGAQLANGDSRVSFRRHDSNKGHIATYNEGIEWLTSDYWLLLSADDYLLPDALSYAVGVMDEDPEISFSFGKAVTQTGNSVTQLPDLVPSKPFLRKLTCKDFFELSGARNIVPTPTAIVRTQLQKRVGGYRPELPHSGDMEMWLRLAAYGPVAMLDVYQAVYRVHAANMSLSYTAETWLPDLCQRKAALDSFFVACSHVLPNPAELRRQLFWSLGCSVVSLASTAFNAGAVPESNRLSDFAVEVCPEIKRSSVWMKLSLKRTLGLRAWRALQPSVKDIR